MFSNNNALSNTKINYFYFLDLGGTLTIAFNSIININLKNIFN